MTYPPQDNSGYGQGNPATGPQSTPDWTAQPTTGAQPTYGQPYDAQQAAYGQQPGYGQPQAFAQQPGYGQQMPYAAAPQAFGGPPSGTRPGSATAAAVLSFIFGTIGFFVSAYALIVLTAGSESGALMGFSSGTDTLVVVSFISSTMIVVASAMVFLGGVQLLGGKTNKWVVIATVMYIAAQVISLVGALVATEGAGLGTLLVGTLVGLALAGVLIFLAKSKDVEAWLSRKEAARASGVEF